MKTICDEEQVIGHLHLHKALRALRVKRGFRVLCVHCGKRFVLFWTEKTTQIGLSGYFLNDE